MAKSAATPAPAPAPKSAERAPPVPVAPILPPPPRAVTPPPARPAAPVGESCAVTTRARILVVDDDPSSLKALSALLERNGHQVMNAVNGKEALKLAMQVIPQIVIADRHMPEMDGVELCRSLRQFEAGRRVYMILLTSDESEDRIVEGFDAGADDYVVKPFKAKILLARVRAGMRVVRMQERIDADKATMQLQVGQLGVAKRMLEKTAVTDPLTDLPNRRAAMDALREGWERSIKDDEPLSAIMIDIDKFKRVNDTCGHDVGDAVLKEAAKTLRLLVEPPAMVCRIGGEEFVVVLPGTGGEAAAAIAEKLRSQVEGHAIKAGRFDGRVTISLGVSTRDGLVRDFEHLLKLADEGLYRAKDAGRNRVCVGHVENVPVEPVS
jgi:diguanylate cyclase (GGDEF)-like protein